MKRKNQAAHPKLIIIALGFIPLFVLLYLYLSPKQPEVQSIFAADTCAPPCWFGIIAGESDYLAVEYLFRNRTDILAFGGYIDDESNPTTDAMNGHYNFYWRNYSGRYRQQMNSIVVIEDNIVDMIAVWANEDISLVQVLDELGQPDDIRYFEEEDLYLYLVYLDSLLVIKFRTANTGCSIESVEDDFLLELAYYYSYQAATSPVEVDGTMQPRLTAYRGDMRQISAEDWQAWLSSEEEISCREAGRLLPETITPIDFPSIP